MTRRITCYGSITHACFRGVCTVRLNPLIALQLRGGNVSKFPHRLWNGLLGTSLLLPPGGLLCAPAVCPLLECTRRVHRLEIRLTSGTHGRASDRHLCRFSAHESHASRQVPACKIPHKFWVLRFNSKWLSLAEGMTGIATHVIYRVIMAPGPRNSSSSSAIFKR